ncbi:hypothetical protein JHK87_043137 [Glycine soja]|nr:hypothetical protein JHK87_043137 [Glycine soja]
MEDNVLVLLFYAMEDKWKLLMSPLLLMLLLISPLASFHLVVNVRVTDDASILKQSKFKPGDEVAFFYNFDQHLWEVLYRKQVKWNQEEDKVDST